MTFSSSSPAAPSGANAHLLRTFRHRDFALLTGGRTLSRFGNAMAPVALAFAVLDLTGSASDLGFVVGARSLPNVAMLLYGGVLADRLRRSTLLQGSTLGAAAVQAVLAVSLLLSFASLPLLIVLSLVNGALSAVALPASIALTPQTVPTAELRPANALVRMGVHLGYISGASLGGVLAASVGSAWAMVGTTVLWLGAALCFRAMSTGPTLSVGPRAHPLSELREGWREFTSRTWVWVVALQFMVVNAVVSGGMQVLGPVVADDTIGRTAWGLTLAAQTVGAVVGGLIAVRLGIRRMLLLGVAVTAIYAVPLLLLAHAPVVPYLLLASFLTGLAMEQFGIAWDYSLQQHVPADRLARVYSYDAVGSCIALPLGEIGAGPLAHHYGTTITLTWGAALVVAVTLAALLSRSIRTLAVKPDAS